MGRARAAHRRSETDRQPWLSAAVAANAGLVLAALYLAPLRELLGTQPLSAAELGVVGLASLAGVAAVLLGRRIGHHT
ncbi:MAG TPA: hypothetical protein VI357_25225 [Mycobacteriales bacterium]